MDRAWAVRGRVVRTEVIDEDAVVVVRDGRICAVLAWAEFAGSEWSGAEVRDTPPGALVLPGLVDVHCHGGGGESFPNAASTERALVAAEEHLRHGTTTLVGSLVTAPPEQLVRGASMLAELCARGSLAGIHFEGPFVSRARAGAQDPSAITGPDVGLTRRLLDAAGGHAVSMTLAPEEDGAYGPGSVSEVLLEAGVLPSWGHCDSDPAEARAAVEYAAQTGRRGAGDSDRAVHSTVTHLFNGMRPLHHRTPGPIAEFVAGAARGRTVLEMICDGVHLHPSIVRDVYETVGREACVLVTDAMAAAGMPDGSYQLGPLAVVVEGGVARLRNGGAIAGGTSHLLDCVRVAHTEAGIPLVDAVYMASAQGARILGDTEGGRIEVGARADLVLVDGELRPLSVWRRGREVA